MTAVFSAPLSSNAPKVVTRTTKTVNQTTKPFIPKSQSTNKPSPTHQSPTNQSPTNQAFNPNSKPIGGGKWKRQLGAEASLDSKPNQRAPTNGSEPLAKEPRIGSPEAGSIWNASESRKRYLGEKAATVEMPTTEAAELCPKFLYDDPTLVIHMCLDCRIASRLLDMKLVDKENQQLVVNLCKICRAAFKSQRRIKFFQHDLLCFKRQHPTEAVKDKKGPLKKFML